MDLLAARQQLSRWLAEIAAERCHGTTHVAPRELFESEERAALLALPPRTYELVERKQVNATRRLSRLLRRTALLGAVVAHRSEAVGACDAAHGGPLPRRRHWARR